MTEIVKSANENVNLGVLKGKIKFRLDKIKEYGIENIVDAKLNFYHRINSNRFPDKQEFRKNMIAWLKKYVLAYEKMLDGKSLTTIEQKLIETMEVNYGQLIYYVDTNSMDNMQITLSSVRSESAMAASDTLLAA